MYYDTLLPRIYGGAKIEHYLAVLDVKKATIYTVAFCKSEPNLDYSQSRIT